jgi:hypothetical protein
VLGWRGVRLHRRPGPALVPTLARRGDDCCALGRAAEYGAAARPILDAIVAVIELLLTVGVVVRHVFTARRTGRLWYLSQTCAQLMRFSASLQPTARLPSKKARPAAGISRVNIRSPSKRGWQLRCVACVRAIAVPDSSAAGDGLRLRAQGGKAIPPHPAAASRAAFGLWRYSSVEASRRRRVERTLAGSKHPASTSLEVTLEPSRERSALPGRAA